MAIDSWGEPVDINRTVTNYGTNGFIQIKISCILKMEN